jgi:hypothetical protein
MTTTKRNPNDTTFRNINALKKRVEKLERAVRDLRKKKAQKSGAA